MCSLWGGGVALKSHEYGHLAALPHLQQLGPLLPTQACGSLQPGGKEVSEVFLRVCVAGREGEAYSLSEPAGVRQQEVKTLLSV